MTTWGPASIGENPTAQSGFAKIKLPIEPRIQHVAGFGFMHVTASRSLSLSLCKGLHELRFDDVFRVHKNARSMRLQIADHPEVFFHHLTELVKGLWRDLMTVLVNMPSDGIRRAK